MKIFVTFFMLAALPFFSSAFGSKSAAFSFSSLRAQEELQEELKEEPDKKPEPKKEAQQEPKKEVKEEPKNVKEEPKMEENTGGLKETFKEEVPEEVRYFREKYEEVYDAQFEAVWNAVKKSIDNLSCMIAQNKYSQTDEGLYKGSIKSDFCVISLGDDTTFTVMRKYSKDFPVIRGGIWVNGRIQFTFILKETTEHKVNMLMKTELSGMERFVTSQVHFWKSNGILEHRMLESIKKNLQSVTSSGGN